MKKTFPYKKYFMPMFLFASGILTLAIFPGLAPLTDLSRKTGLPLLSLEISNKDIYKLDQRVLRNKDSQQSENSRRYIVGSALFDEKRYPVEVRTRGSFSFHRDFKRKSWRFKSPFHRMIFANAVRFNIARSRYPHFEDHLAYQLAAEAGLPAPHSFPLLFMLNGDWQGVYHFSEQTDELFLLKNNLPYGPIFGDYKGKERDVTTFATVTGSSGRTLNASPWTDGFENINNTFWQYLTLRDQEKTGQAAPLDHFLHFLHGDDGLFQHEVQEYIDLESFLDWQAFQIFAGSPHSDIHNLRIFFNPEKDGFQFLPWDLMPFKDYSSHRRMPVWWVPHGHKLILRLNQIPEFAEIRNRHVWNLIHSVLPPEIIKRKVDDLYKKLRLVYAHDPEKAFLEPNPGAANPSQNRVFSLDEFDTHHLELRKWLQERRTFLLSSLAITEQKSLVRQLEKSLWQILMEQSTEAGLQLEGIQVSLPEPVVRKFSVWFDADHDHKFSPNDVQLDYNATHTGGNIRIRLKSPFPLLSTRKLMPEKNVNKGVKYVADNGHERTLPGHIRQPLPQPTYYSFLIQVEDHDQTLSGLEPYVKNSVTGETVPVQTRRFKKITNYDALTWGHDYRISLDNWQTKATTPKREPQTITWQGEKTVDQTVFIEKHQTLVIQPGTTVKLTENGSLMIFGTIKAQSTEQAPIRFTSMQPQNNWGVIAINNGTGLFDSVIIERASEATIRHIPYSGALSAYNSTITVKNAVFRDNLGDDGINVKYGQAQIDQSRFEENTDAIDCDFSTCEITNNIFQNNRNDAVDIGSSSTILESNTITGSGDKGVSVGGDSTAEIKENRILANNIGLAVKDSSLVIFEESEMTENNLGVAIYVKNKDYKLMPPTFELRSGRIRNNEINLWRQEKTVLRRPGGHLEANKKTPNDIQFDLNTLFL